MPALTRERKYLVKELGGWECAWCGAEENLTLDHVHPRAVGGRSRLRNLRVLCYDCNQNRAKIASALRSAERIAEAGLYSRLAAGG